MLEKTTDIAGRNFFKIHKKKSERKLRGTQAKFNVNDACDVIIFCCVKDSDIARNIKCNFLYVYCCCCESDKSRKI